jgi:hypothetical protein
VHGKELGMHTKAAKRHIRTQRSIGLKPKQRRPRTVFVGDQTSLINYILNTHYVVLITCKKCGEPNFLTPHAFLNIEDFDAKCEKCETDNRITWRRENLRNKYSQ